MSESVVRSIIILVHQSGAGLTSAVSKAIGGCSPDQVRHYAPDFQCRDHQILSPVEVFSREMSSVLSGPKDLILLEGLTHTPDDALRLATLLKKEDLTDRCLVVYWSVPEKLVRARRERHWDMVAVSDAAFAQRVTRDAYTESFMPADPKTLQEILLTFTNVGIDVTELHINHHDLEEHVILQTALLPWISHAPIVC